jgi:hypothetical protein
MRAERNRRSTRGHVAGPAEVNAPARPKADPPPAPPSDLKQPGPAAGDEGTIG